MFLILENFRDFENNDGDFPLDRNGKQKRCDGCAGIFEQYLIIEKAAFCKGCLERGIDMLNKNFIQHSKYAWNKRLEKEVWKGERKIG